MCLSRSGVANIERLEPGVEEEGGHGVDELGFEEFNRRHLGQREAPGIAIAQVDLLQVLVEPAFWEKVGARFQFFGKEGRLGKTRRFGEASQIRGRFAFGEQGVTAQPFVGAEEGVGPDRADS